MCFLCYDSYHLHWKHAICVNSLDEMVCKKNIYSGIAYFVISLPISALIPSICGCVYCTRLNFSSYMKFIYNCFVSRQFWSVQTEKLISSFLLTHLSSIIMGVIIAKVTTVLSSGNSILRAPIWHIYNTKKHIKQQSLSSYCQYHFQ